MTGTRRRRWPAAVVAFGTGVGVTLGVSAAVDGDGSSASNGKSLVLETVAIESRDLATFVEYSGTLASGESVVLSAEADGTVTEAIPVSTALVAGTVLARIDGEPVIVVPGATPTYRDLQSGVEDGADIAQLEAYLVAAGFDPNGKVTVDQTWATATTTAVKAWQESTGQDETGIVLAANMVFVPEGATVTVAPKVGESVRAGGTLATVELPTTPTVTLAVSVNSLERFVVGDVVDVELTDGSIVDGTVATVGSIATAAAGPDAEPTVAVTITLAVATPVLDGPATVRLPDETATGVLTVPTRALVALAEGGQALELVADDGPSALVAVETGMYVDGYVEVDGSGLEAGIEVVVPR